jgi:hypothetical protein
MSAYKNGLWNALNEKKLLFWLYGFNLLFAYILALPVSMMIANALDKTTTADRLLQAADITVLITFMMEYGKSISFVQLLTAIGILYIIFNIFFAGGILKTFVEEKKFELSDFFSGCIEYFNRFLRLFLISLIFFILIIILNFLLSKFFGIFTKDATTEHLPFILFFLRVLILSFLLAFVNMLFDYAKIMTVVNDFYGMFKTVNQAFIFVMMSMRKTIGLYMLFLFTAIILMAVYLFIESLLNVTSGLMVLIFFIWTQIYMISRVWIRMSFFAGQYSLYRHSNTAMPGMTKEMLDKAVTNYENRVRE